MPNRRDFLKAAAAGATAIYAGGGDVLHGGAAYGALQAPATRRTVAIGGRRVTVIDVHAHCIIPVEDIVKGTALAENGGGAGEPGPRSAADLQSWISRASMSRR